MDNDGLPLFSPLQLSQPAVQALNENPHTLAVSVLFARRLQHKPYG